MTPLVLLFKGQPMSQPGQSTRPHDDRKQVRLSPETPIPNSSQAWLSPARRALMQSLLFTAAAVLGVLLLGSWAASATAPLLLILLASILALALNPFVVWLEMHGLPRGLGAVFVVVGLTSLLIGGAALIAPLVYAQGSSFFDDLPGTLERVRTALPPWLERVPGLTGWLSGDGGLQQLLQSGSGLLGSSGAAVFSGFTVAAGAFFSAVFSITLLLTLVIFLLSNPQPIVRGLLSAVPGRAREPLERLLVRLGKQLSSWLVGALCVSLVLGTVVAIGLASVGFRDAILFGVIYAVCNMIPLIGPLIGTLPAILTALALGNWTMVLWAVLIPILVQQFDGYFFSPWVFRRTTQLHPVSVLTSVALFGSLMGFVGTFLAVPMTIIVKALFEEIYLPAVNNPEVSDEDVSNVLGATTQNEQDLSVLAPSETEINNDDLRAVHQ